MSITLPTSVTGAAQAGFTSPTFTLAVGTYPGYNGRQNYVTNLGGTQTGVRVHSATDPFTMAVWTAPSFKAAPSTANTGAFPMNVSGFNIRKGMLPSASIAAVVGTLDVKFRIPAGAESYDAPSIRALCSLGIAALTAISSGLGDTLVSGQL